MIEIQLVRPDQFEEAGEITASAWSHLPSSDGLQEFLARVADVAGRAETAAVYVASIDGRLLGSVTLELDSRVFDPDNPNQLASDECHVRMLGVAPSAKRTGIARALMAHCIDVARTADKRVMTLNTSEQNTAAQKLYESMGFARAPDIPSSYGSRLRAYRYEL
jgi:ribosomal protein S18 acetylase RimI-like enzyme